MKVIYDYQIFCMQEYGGISRYYYELIKYYAKNSNCDAKIIAPLFINKYLCDLNKALIVGRFMPNINRTYRIRKYINLLVTKLLLPKYMPDIIHETYYSSIKIAPPKIKSVITVYDMIHEKYPDHVSNKDHKLPYLKLKSINRADHVICISENTKNDLIEITNIHPSKTSVIYLGFSLSAHSPITDSVIHGRPYLLFVGHRDGYKNFHRLLQAYATSKHLVSDFDLVCFGGFEFSPEERTAIGDVGLTSDKVRRIGGNDKVLANLYSNAAALIYPSFYEGFGIPILEAMSYHCPVVCSKTSSMPEVAGDAAEYFDPLALEDIQKCIRNVVYSKEKSNVLISRGLNRIKQFSWEKCAQQTYEMYSSLL